MNIHAGCPILYYPILLLTIVYYNLKLRFYGTLIYYGKTMVLWKKNYGTMDKTVVLY